MTSPSDPFPKDSNSMASLEFAPHLRKSQKPMAVLCLGLSCTGTMFTYRDLKILGHNFLHMVEAGLATANGALKKWRNAIEAKYYKGKGKKLKTAEDFDEVLWWYDATSGIPSIHFPEELIKAYPNDKIILNECDPDSWVRSINNIFLGILNLRMWQFLAWFDVSHGDLSSDAALHAGFLEYNEHIKAIVPKERLLVFHPKKGWVPLCKFLNQPVLKTSFPKINGELDVYHWFVDFFRKFPLIEAAKFWAKRLLPVGVATMSVWMYRGEVWRSIAEIKDLIKAN